MPFTLAELLEEVERDYVVYTICSPALYADEDSGYDNVTEVNNLPGLKWK